MNLDLNDQETRGARIVYMQLLDEMPKYIERIKSMILKEEIRLIIDLNDLRNLSRRELKNY